MKKEYIYEYFYNFLCFVLIYKSSESLVDNWDLKHEYMNRMSEINQKYNLFEVDEGFSELIYDMETTISAKSQNLHDLEFSPAH